MRPKPLVLAVLDGWGIAPPGETNAIHVAKTPYMDRFLREFPAVPLYASGNEVGLRFGEMGNSEVGHLNIGAGRVYYQTLPRINKSIVDGTFFENQALVDAAMHAKQNKSALHIVGIVSSGNVHGSNEHVYAALQLAKKYKVKKVYVHMILDGRDIGPQTGLEFVVELEAKMKELKVGKLATLSGRKFAMDRNNRWDRVEKSYRAIAEGVADTYFKKGEEAVQASYDAGVYDEEFIPVVIGTERKPEATIQSNDAVIFTNFRSDRARELTKALVLPTFHEFERQYIEGLHVVTMTEYEKELPVLVAFAPIVIHNSLAETISKAGLRQYHVAETEKYAHITFFLNGTIEEPFPGEERKIVPSLKVGSYDQAPEMSAADIAKEVVRAIESEVYDVIVCNFANADMVGHTGIFDAAVKGCEAVDVALGSISEHVLAHNGVFMITADHGNAENMVNLQTGEPDKEHTTNPVPLIVIGNQFRGQAGVAGDVPEGDLSLLPPIGMLADVAPTVLNILELPIPEEMVGRPLI